MKPNELKWYVEMKHSEMKNKPEEYFLENLMKCAFRKCYVNTTTLSSKPR
jgi:hypothetical protein